MKDLKDLKSRKNLLTLGTIFAVVASSVCTFAAVQLYWLTPGERDAARPALAAVEVLQNSRLVAGDDADEQTKQAEDAVETARQAAQTARDQDVAFQLSQYLGSIEAGRAMLRMPGLAQEQIAAPAVQDLEPVDVTQLSGTPATRTLRFKLHQTLD